MDLAIPDMPPSYHLRVSFAREVKYVLDKLGPGVFVAQPLVRLWIAAGSDPGERRGVK